MIGRGAGGPLEESAVQSAEPEPSDVLAALGRADFEEGEVYVKRGRSRRLVQATGVRAATFHEERGWAVRASTRRASLFVTGTGAAPVEGPWPQPDGHPIVLPEALVGGRPAPWSEPADIESPLIGEAEGARLLAAIDQELTRELPAARLVRSVLEDGSSRSRLASTRGVEADWRNRLALLHLEAESPDGAVAVDLCAREARRFGPGAIARRLADRLALVGASPPAGFAARDRGELLLAPPLLARLLAGLAPYLVGPRAGDRVGALRDRRGRIGSAALTVVDDGRFPGGLLEAPVDGEGVATRAVALIEEGVFRQPLVAWHQARKTDARPSGCSRRPSWRDLPRPGPTHLYLAPSPGVAVADLLADLARGYYLLDAVGPVALDLAAGTFSLRVAGFAVQSGRAVAPAGGLALTGSVGALLRGVQAVARDLDFVIDDGLVGAPTALVTGLELRPVGW